MSERPVVIARVPELQPQVDFIRAFMRERDWSATRLSREIYGRDANGTVRGHGSLSPLINGIRSPGKDLARTIKDAIGLDLSAFTRPHGNGIRPPEKPRTRAAAALVAYESRHGPVVGSPRQPPEQPAPRPRLLPPPADDRPRLALSIGNDGRGSLSFNLVDAPAADVMRAFSVLQAAGLTADTDVEEAA